GMGSIMPAAIQTATLGVDRHFAGVASAMVNTSQQVGGSIGTALLNTLATTAAASYLVGKKPTAAVNAQAQLHSYETAYWWSAAFFTVGFVITFLLFRPGAPRIAASPQEGTEGEESASPAVM
ncbi:MAG TPA: MFS transporter, partial [Streptomyces sp.]